MFSSSHFLSIEKPNTMSKRAQEIRTALVCWIDDSELVIKKFLRESVSRVGFGYINQRGEIADRVGVLISQALGNQGETETNKFSLKFSNVTEMTILLQVPRDRGERWISVRTLRDPLVKCRTTLQRWSWTTTVSGSPLLDTRARLQDWMANYSLDEIYFATWQK